MLDVLVIHLKTLMVPSCNIEYMQSYKLFNLSALVKNNQAAWYLDRTV